MLYKITRPARYLLTMSFAALTVACGTGNDRNDSMKSVSIDWAAVGSKKIVFGHQSVGGDILVGIREIASASGLNYSIQEARSPPIMAGVTHFKIGENGNPLSKISDFGAAIDGGAANGADVAAMKLCYLDFDARTDARQVAEAYIRMLDELSARHPRTRFVAITAPLMVTQTGPKVWIKRILGKPPAQLVENAKRGEFNALLRERFGASGSLFDLARVEATSAPVFESNGQSVESLNPTLTDDGGHLNAAGRALIAPVFLQGLAGDGRLSGRS